MDSLEHMRNAIDYIEKNLDGEIAYAKIAGPLVVRNITFKGCLCFSSAYRYRNIYAAAV